jgi:glycine oxidase
VAGKRVVIAGGGLIGCAIAWRLAERGADVHVIESARPGMAASWAAAGMLAPLFEAPNAAMRDLLARSLNRYQDFVDELRAVSGIDAELQLGGKLDIAHTDDELRLLRKHYGDSVPAGVRELSAAEVRDIEPNVTQDFTAALLSENDGSVDNRKLARAAWVAASNAGATFTTGASVREVLYTRSTLEAVVLSTGERLAADAVVVCAGAWSSSIRGLPRPLPVFPVRGQMVSLEAIPRATTRIVADHECYIIPRSDGRVLVGSTVERVGFDLRTTASGIAHLLRVAIRLVPMLANAPVIETWAGLRPGTADDLPILGEDPHAPGVYYATGHYRNGILLAPITADVIAAAVSGERAEINLQPFSAGRFHG